MPYDLPIVPAFKVSFTLLKVTVSPPVLPGNSFKINVGLAITLVSLEAISAFNRSIKVCCGNVLELLFTAAEPKLDSVGGTTVSYTHLTLPTILPV